MQHHVLGHDSTQPLRKTAESPSTHCSHKNLEPRHQQKGRKCTRRRKTLPKAGRHTVKWNVKVRGSERWGHNVLKNTTVTAQFTAFTQGKSGNNSIYNSVEELITS